MNRAWPRRIVEVPSKRPDPRVDPQATQKISREMLDDALRRTKSGTRPAMRSEHEPEHHDDDSFFGPRDSTPEITIVRIDSMEMSVFDPAGLPPPAPAPATTEVPSHITPIPVAPPSRRLHVTPRLAFLVGLAVATFIAGAAIIGFFAGRITGH
ncbi:hypothetical protein BH11MYX4_BH11MYX4_55520 [soil metagenome]